MVKVHLTFCGDVKRTWTHRTLDAAVKRALRMTQADGWGMVIEAPAAQLVSVGDGGYILPERFGDIARMVECVAAEVSP